MPVITQTWDVQLREEGSPDTGYTYSLVVGGQIAKTLDASDEQLDKGAALRRLLG
jgi:hypothetical protein